MKSSEKWDTSLMDDFVDCFAVPAVSKDQKPSLQAIKITDFSFYQLSLAGQ